MQYKQWVAKHRIGIPEEEGHDVFSETEDDKMDHEAEDEAIEEGYEEEKDSGISD